MPQVLPNCLLGPSKLATMQCVARPADSWTGKRHSVGWGGQHCGSTGQHITSLCTRLQRLAPHALWRLARTLSSGAGLPRGAHCCRFARGVLVREDPMESFMKRIPADTDQLEVIYPVSAVHTCAVRAAPVACSRKHRPAGSDLSRDCHAHVRCASCASGLLPPALPSSKHTSV